MASVINRSECKKLVLKYAKERSDKFTRVSSEYLNDLEIAVMLAIRRTVQTHPSIGKTIKQFNSIIKKG